MFRSFSFSRSLPRLVLCLMAASPALACVTPTTNLAGVSPDVVRAEQLKQQQLVIRSDLELQRRVDDLGYELLRAALPLCTEMAGVRRGVRFANIHQYSREYQPAASALGFNDTLMIVGVARGGTSSVRAGRDTE